jgi:hypothetical protein
MSLPDIRARFTFRTWSTGAYFYKEASGELGVPGQVQTFRNPAAQRVISSGTGEHAGHLIGVQFGAPGDDPRNMSLQNPNMNTFAPKALQEALRGPGGSYHDLESRWSAHLKQGSRVFVTVRDQFRTGEQRPFSRRVEWYEIAPNGTQGPKQSLDFGNFSSPQSRAAGRP